MTMTLTFCGAARTVTGSCYWLQTPGASFLIDCGMFQGPKTLKELNYGEFPFVPAKLDFVLQTHAHIDHSGLLPKLHMAGFDGPAFMTRGTRDLLSFMLPDSGHIQEMEVEQLNQRNAKRGRPQVEPIYTSADAEACQDNFRTVEYDRWFEAGDGVRARYWNAGHILGSASIELELATGRRDQRLLRMLFSGDIGPEHKLFHPDPDAADNLDYVICESTYGGRKRTRVNEEQRRMVLAGEVKDALRADGMLLIPSFAVERTQELLADLTVLQGSGAIPQVPIFLDSPMAIKATDVFARHMAELDGGHHGAGLLRNPQVRFTETVAESKAIARFRGGAIIMAASGMCEAGRIRHHLKHHLWRREATVLLVGYQAPGTLGRLLADGAPAVRIQGEDIQVRARIRQIDVYSGHADGTELVDWVRERLPIKRALFLCHGEEDEAEAMRNDLTRRDLDAERVIVPTLDDQIDLLGDGTGPRQRPAPRRLAPEAVVRLDWHNELASFELDLREALDQAADERSRNVLLRRLRRALTKER
jgi:metallo-beta-lactamase family protein